MRTLTTMLLCLIFSLSCTATVYYVTPSGAGNMTGTSWQQAFPANLLQNAINLAQPGDQVWVAKGTYKTTNSTDRTVAFKMKNGVTIYGSFNGTEQTLAQRPSGAVTSILTGEIGAAGVLDNAYHIISNKNINNTAVMDGFLIRDANDDRPVSDVAGLGGGIYNDGNFSSNNCSPTFRNCIIAYNQATFGAGIFNSGQLGGNSSPTLINCVFAFNHATEGGGAMDNFGLGGTASPVISNCVFYTNSATYRGGAMYSWGGNNGQANPQITNCSFVNNTAVDGGALVCANNNSGTGNSGTATAAIKNSIFHGNTASGTGPQFFTIGDGSFSATYSLVPLTGQTSPHTVSGPATGNIQGDPKFVNLAVGAGADQLWLTADDGLKLTAASPCINSGENTGVSSTDIAGNTRITGPKVDMGPYEFASGNGIEKSVVNPITLFPNPTRSILYISGTEQKCDVSITDSHGQVVTNFNVIDKSIDVSNLAVGIYYISVNTPDGYWLCRFTNNNPIMIQQVLLTSVSLLFVQLLSAQITTREEPFRNPQTVVEQEMPENYTLTTTRRESLTGEVISVCSGYRSRSGEVMGIIKLKDENGNLYSILVPATENPFYKKGMKGSITVFPLPENGRYYIQKPTCESTKDSIIVLLGK